MEFMGWLATIAFGICYWPQIYHSYKLKTVGDISPWSWTIQLVGYVLGFFYGAWLKQMPLIIGYAHGLFCTILLLCMYRKYRGNS
jgi:uncharacterized protein with PQ loop repeat